MQRTPHIDPGAAARGEAELTIRSSVLQLTSVATCRRPAAPALSAPLIPCASKFVLCVCVCTYKKKNTLISYFEKKIQS